MYFWNFSLTWYNIIIALAAAAFFLFYGFNRIRNSGNHRISVTVSEIIRLFAVAMLLFSLFAPELVYQYIKDKNPQIALLYDKSMSMLTEDIKMRKQQGAI